MAKNADDIKKLQDIAIALLDGNNNGWDDAMARMPLNEGDTLTFTGEAEMQKSTSPGVPDWAALLTKEGYPIGYRQLARRGNGLKFKDEVKTPKDAIRAIIEKAASLDNGLTLQLKEVRKIESSTRKGKNTYYIFEDTEI